MAKKILLLGMLVITLTFGIMVAGCDEDQENGTGNGNNNGNGNSTSGTFTLNDIPSEYDGKYAHLYAISENLYLDGDQDIDLTTGITTLALVSNGSVSIPMWYVANNTVQRFFGSHTFDIDIKIVDFSTFSNKGGTVFSGNGISVLFKTVAFTNGSATRSFSNAEH